MITKTATEDRREDFLSERIEVYALYFYVGIDWKSVFFQIN